MRNLVASLLCLLLCATALGATRYVSPTGSATSPYDTWAKAATSLAVVVVGSADGDTVYVTNGTYSGFNPSGVNTNLTFISMNGPDYTTINADNTGKDYAFYGKNATFIGFKFTGTSNDYGSVLNGGGLLIISNCIFHGMFIDLYGGGAALHNYNAGADTRVFNSRFSDCKTTHVGGGAVYVLGGTTATFTDCDFSNCYAQGSSLNGGAIYVASGGKAYLNRCTFSYCNATNDGGAIYAQSGEGIVASNLVIRYCIAGRYSAACHYTRGYNILAYGNVSLATDAGVSVSLGGIYYNCTFIGNGTPNLTGAALWNAEWYNCIVWFNYPSDLNGYWGTNTCYQKKSGTPGLTDCITNYPVFVDTGYDVNPTNTNTGMNFTLASGNVGLKLQSTSPCIDKGTNLAWDAAAVDLAGDARRYNTFIDMGCYEYSPGAPPASGVQHWKGVELE